MQQLNEPGSNENVWQAIAPVLDGAIGSLGAKDRNAIILRFFEGKSFRQVGTVLGLNEDSARMRVSRAVEKLRSSLLKRKVAVPAVTLASLLAAHSVTAAAPAPLAVAIASATAVKGAASSGSVLTILQGTLKIMAWTKIKTAAVVGTVALLAIGTAMQQRTAYCFRHGLVTLHARNAPLAEVIHKIERQTGQKICWDPALNRPVTLEVSNLPLPQVLDKLIMLEGAYWGTDFAVYESQAGLDKLVDALQGGARLQAAGWTNLSGAKIDYAYTVKFHYPNGTSRYDRGASSGVPRRDYRFVRLSFEANLTNTQTRSMEAQMEANAKKDLIGQAIYGPSRSAGEANAAEGVLAPERLVAEITLAARLEDKTPAPATPEEADKIAKAAQAAWTTIYTMRKSPIAESGIRLVHLGEPMLPRPTNFSQTLQQGKIEMLTLSPEQREDHARALARLREKH